MVDIKKRLEKQFRRAKISMEWECAFSKINTKMTNENIRRRFEDWFGDRE